MKVAVFNTKRYDQEFLSRANKKYGHEMSYLEVHLTRSTAPLAQGHEAVCAFVNDQLDREVLNILADGGVKLIALRCAGFNQVDLKAAQEYEITIARVPAYSPHGVAEHAIGLMLALNRKIHRAHNRIREGNFSLEGLLGFELYGKTVGIVGTGKIGRCMVRILKGFQSRVLAYDVHQDEECVGMGAQYVALEQLYKESDIISLHLPLMRETYHVIDKKAVDLMKQGVMIINTSRGALVDTKTVIHGLKSGKIGYLGLDVYEEEGDMFFEDLSGRIIQDDVFARLLTFPNVIITGHQAFFTETALRNIAETTMENIARFQQGKIEPQNLVTLERIRS